MKTIGCVFEQQPEGVSIACDRIGLAFIWDTSRSVKNRCMYMGRAYVFIAPDPPPASVRPHCGKLQQLWHGLNIPVGMIRLRVTEIGAELDHLPVRIKPLSIPANNRLDRECMPQIVDARTTPMLAEVLRRASRSPEIRVQSCSARRSRSDAGHRHCGRMPHALLRKFASVPPIGGKSGDAAWGNPHETGPTILTNPHCDDAAAEVHVIIIQIQGLVDAQARGGNEPNKVEQVQPLRP